ncbi:DUF3099 domain-containing protein [Leucobacter zeae]|nr:DUF3099 domain-containing protein [Leucobacter zeae]
MARETAAGASYSVTSVGVNPAEDRAHRMRMYFIAMSLRVLCVVSLFWLRGWWILVPAIGSVVLPWFAVMVGNAVAHGGGRAPDAPEPLRLVRGESDAADARPDAARVSDDVIVVDVVPERRGASRTGAPVDDAPRASEDPDAPRGPGAAT